MICWHFSVAVLTPNNNLLYLYKPFGRANVVISHDSGCNSIWRNGMFKWSIQNAFACEISCRVSSTVGTGCFSLMIMRGFSTTTKRLTQLVGPFTFLIMSSASSSSSLSTTLRRLLKGILRWGCGIGATYSSLCYFN